MTVKLLTEHHLELKRDCTGSSESTLVKIPHCLKSHVVGHIMFCNSFVLYSQKLTCQLSKDLDQLSQP